VCVTCKLAVDLKLLARKSLSLYRFIRKHDRDLLTRGIDMLSDVVSSGKLNWNKIPALLQFLRRASLLVDEHRRELDQLHARVEKSDEYVQMYHQKHHGQPPTSVYIVPAMPDALAAGNLLWSLHETLTCLCDDIVETHKILARLIEVPHVASRWPHFGTVPDPRNSKHVNTMQLGLMYPVHKQDENVCVRDANKVRQSPFAYMRTGLVTHAPLHYFLTRIKQAFSYLHSATTDNDMVKAKLTLLL
jgi:hypothetical protein